MKSRYLTVYCLLLLSALVCHAKQKPNVLLIMIDDLNDWLGCYGVHSDALTPNIDKLSEQATVFTNAHCQSPLCGPSRTSLMTGKYPSKTGVYGHIADERLAEIKDELGVHHFLPEYFREHGYYTMGKGKLFHQGAPEGVFDEFGGRVPRFGPYPKKRFHWFNKRTNTDWGAYPEKDEEMPDVDTVNWGIEQINKEHDQPFFLALGFLRPHVPLYVPQKWFDMHPIEKADPPPYKRGDQDDIPEISRLLHELPMMPTTDWMIENKQWRHVTQSYLACVTFVDHYVGKILDALEQSSYADNTIVIVTSDHGYHMGEKNRYAKHSLWDRATKVPLLIHVPGQESGARVNEPVGLIDLYPTLIELCGLPENDENEGLSLSVLFQDTDVKLERLGIRTNYGRGNYSLRTEYQRIIRYEDGSGEFYDLRTDPHEWNNMHKIGGLDAYDSQYDAGFPAQSLPWNKHSHHTVNEYMMNQYQ